MAESELKNKKKTNAADDAHHQNGDDGSDICIERMDYIETIVYRGYSVPVFADDSGQCLYCIFAGREMCFGTFQTDYVSQVVGMVDRLLDRKTGA